MHDPDYRTAQKDWASFVETLTQKIIESDETIPELPVKDVVSQRITSVILPIVLSLQNWLNLRLIQPRFLGSIEMSDSVLTPLHTKLDIPQMTLCLWYAYYK